MKIYIFKVEKYISKVEKKTVKKEKFLSTSSGYVYTKLVQVKIGRLDTL